MVVASSIFISSKPIYRVIPCREVSLNMTLMANDAIMSEIRGDVKEISAE